MYICMWMEFCNESLTFGGNVVDAFAAVIGCNGVDVGIDACARVGACTDAGVGSCTCACVGTCDGVGACAGFGGSAGVVVVIIVNSNDAADIIFVVAS